MKRTSILVQAVFLAWSALLIPSCTSTATEIHVVVYTDLPVPSGVDELRITASIGGAVMMSATARLGAGEAPLPRTLVLAHRGGPLGPVRIEAQALLSGTVRVMTVRELAFQQDRILTVRIDADAACETASCPGQTCGPGGVCRPIEVPPCELEGACPDAGVGDAGMADADSLDGSLLDASSPDASDAAAGDTGLTDTPADTGPACTIGSALCLAGSYVVGEEVSLVPCTPSPPGVTLSYRTRLPGGMAEVIVGTVRVSQPGEYSATISQDGTPGCDAVGTFTGTVFGLMAAAGGPSTSLGDYHDLAARLDMAFFATRNAGWAVTDAGWRDLRVGSSGTFVNDRLETVEVLQGRAFFARDGDESIINRVTVADGFSSIAISNAAIPASGDRTARHMAVPFSETASGSEGPLLMGTRAGWLLLEGTADALVGRAVGPVWDVEAGAAIGLSESSTRGRVWGLSRDFARNFNDTMGSAGAFNMGNLAATPAMVGQARAMAVDDRAASPARLWLCGDTGVQVFDLLGTDWSGRAFFPVPLATFAGACRDIALDPSDGGAWVATSTGLMRLDHEGAALGAVSGIPAGGIAFVYVAFDGTRRQVWVLADTLNVYRVEAAN